MRPDGRISTREAASLYGCTPNHLPRAMAAAGFSPVIAEYVSVHGGCTTHYFWMPAEVRTAQRRARRSKSASGRKNVAKWNELPAEVRESKVRHRRLERLRKYYQAKAASRAAA